jgi:hypothetical protein
MSMLTAGFKKVRKALHLPPLTIGNTITKYGPAAVMAATGNPMGAAATMYGTGAVAQPRAIGNSTFPGFPSFAAPAPAGGSSASGGDQNWLQSILGGIGSAVGKAGGYIKDNPLDVALAGLATAQGVNSAKAAAQQGKYSDAAVKGAEARWAQQAPLRAQGIQRALNPKTFDYSSVYTDPQNPFAAGMRKPLSPPTARIDPSVPTRPVGPPSNRLPTGPTAGRRPLILPKGPKLLPSRASY